MSHDRQATSVPFLSARQDLQQTHDLFNDRGFTSEQNKRTPAKSGKDVELKEGGGGEREEEGRLIN